MPSHRPPSIASVSTEADFRLPRTVVPSHYDLTLAPDLDTATFTGSVSAAIDVKEPVRAVVVNAIELEISSATLVSPNGERLEAVVTYDEPMQRAILTLGAVADPGPWRLEADFTGTLNDQLHGFYRSTFKTVDGTQRTIATTQFEATEARRAFPCWDEPDLKATFSVTLVVDDGLLAVSNAAEVSREPVGDGKVAVAFART
ncbi:MAG: M1 family peptidase, partial [Actinobacteria bacterium]